MSRSTARAPLALLALLVACDADFGGDLDYEGPDALRFDFGDMRDQGQGGDMGDRGVDEGVACGPGQIFDGITCIAVPDDPCTLTDPLLGPGCVDADGDCFPDKCDAAIPEHLRDCDDANADRRPGLIEGCDGVDNDCDGAVDEAFDLGARCEACGRDGITECGPAGEAVCSVQAGQSAEVLYDERCNGEDEDCDGQIDEGCLLELAPADRRTPRWCADRLLWIVDGALVAWPLDTREATVLDAGPVAEPICDATRDAWLRTAACAGGGVGEPFACDVAQLMARVDGVVRPLSPFGALGAPAIGTDAVYLHEGALDPTLLRAPFDGMPADPLANGVADPTAPVDDLLIARAFRGDQVVMEGVGINRPSRTLDSPGQAPPGRPARSGALIAWIAGETPVLWVLQASSLGQGVQVGSAVGGVPWITPGMVWWQAPDGLRRFDAATGEAQLIAPGPIDADRLWIGREGRVQLVEEGVRLWPSDPTRFVVAADAGVADLGPEDAGVADADRPDARGDAGVDAAPDGAP